MARIANGKGDKCRNDCGGRGGGRRREEARHAAFMNNPRDKRELENAVREFEQTPRKT